MAENSLNPSYEKARTVLMWNIHPGMLKKVLTLLLISVVPPTVGSTERMHNKGDARLLSASELMREHLAALAGGQRKETPKPVSPQGKHRVIHFPNDKCLGALSVPYKGVDKPLYPNYYGPWEYFGQAQADVAVPADEKLQLDIGPKCLRNLPLLSTLGPNDIHRLVITGHDEPVVKPDETVMPHLRHLTGLKELELGQIEPSGAGLKHVRGLKSLEHLVVQSPNIRDGDLAYLSELKSLETLTLTSKNITDAGLGHLPELRALRELFLSGSFRGPGLAHLAQLPSLTSLSLWSRRLAYDGLNSLKDVPSLRKLEVCYPDRSITNAELDTITQITQLEELMLSGEPSFDDRALARLQSMPNLKKLDIGGLEITDTGLSYLKEIKSLESLKNLSITDKGLAYLAELSKLRFLSLGSKQSWTDAGLMHLAGLSSLEEIRIGGDAVTDKVISHIAKLPNIRYLLVGGNITNDGLAELTKLKSLTGLAIGPNCKGVSVAGLNRVNAIPTLASLEVHHPSKDNAVLDISRLTYLENLQLNGFIIGDEDLASLAKLKRLKRLIIICWKGEKKITDSGLKHLSGLTSLKWLSVSCPQADDMTDDGLAYLANLKKLQNLSVGEGNFTDRGLRHLEALKGLTSLQIISENAFSNAASERLQNELPNVRAFMVMP